MNKPIIFFDLETTGVSITKDRIVQIAMIKLLPTGERDARKSLVNPLMPIPADSTAVHGITDEMVKDAPTFKQLSKSIIEFSEGCDLAGYNSDKFDIPLLIEEFGRIDLLWPEEGTLTLDMLKLERVLTSHKLGDTYKRYTGKDLEGAHDALADVEGTIAVLEGQILVLDKEDIKWDLSDVCTLAHFYNEGTQTWDFAGNFYQADEKAYWNFGKHKDKLLDYDISYCNWFLSNEFSIDSKRKLRQYLKFRKV
jgi:DNA polymerase-3 subunit epsilon